MLTAQLLISELLHRLDDPQLSDPGRRDIEDALDHFASPAARLIGKLRHIFPNQ